MADVRINLTPLLRTMKIPRSVFNGWAARYRGFARERFSRLSRGVGGEWPALKPATIARRRKGKGPGSAASILIDSGTMFAALDPQVQRPGALEDPLRNGIRVGFGGPDRHPTGDATIADIAGFHQLGAGTLPKREIIVEPPTIVTEAMAMDVTNYWKRTTD